MVAATAAGAAAALPLGVLASGGRPTAVVLLGEALLATLVLASGVATVLAARRRTATRELAQRERAREAAKRATAEAERARAERRATAHEVKGPLAVAMGHVELVAEDPALSPEHRESLEAGLRNAHRTLDLVTRLLVGSPTVPASTVSTDLAALARDAVEDIAPLAVRRQVAVSLDAAGPMTVVGDPTRLRQVVDNLLSNAVKYADDAGWADVLVAAQGDRVLLQVTNGGTTLTPEEADHALEAEFRGAATADSGVPGAGIGLAVVKDVVTSHAGEVELTSDPQAGTTTVRVLLPQG